MISNVCKIENGTRDLAAILRESEKVAEYNGLTHKQALQLRLICEEIDGDLWIEFENGVCRVNVSLRYEDFTAEKKESLVALAKNKKNAAAVGIVGKIRSVLEDMFLDEDIVWGADVSPESVFFTTGYHDRMDYARCWSLEQYRASVKQAEKAEAWDELEKSVIASVADDVIVGVKGKKVTIVIQKNFA